MVGHQSLGDELRSRIPDKAVFTSLHTRDNSLPEVLCPSSTEQVQEIIQTAGRHNASIEVHKNGAAAYRTFATATGSRPRIIVDLCKRMNAIISIDDALGYCVVEPGVTFRQLFDALERAGSPFMISCPDAADYRYVLDSVSERGDGVAGYSDHFGASCGMEIVMADGAIVRTGDGALDVQPCPSWHLSRYSFGPNLDSIFTQSNLGIITKVGIWLMPRPKVILPFAFKFSAHRLGDVVENVRQLKLDNQVPTPIRLTNEEFLLAEDRPRIESELALVGPWNLSGGIYASSDDSAEAILEGLKERFLPMAGHLLPLAAMQSSDIWKSNIDALKGIPTDADLSGRQHEALWFEPVLPMLQTAIDEMLARSYEIFRRYGFSPAVSFHCGPRTARMRHCLSYRTDDVEKKRSAHQCYLALMHAYTDSSYTFAKIPAQFNADHKRGDRSGNLALLDRLKSQLDPRDLFV